MSRSTLTRDEVLESQRPAWVDRGTGQFFYDGVSMWRGTDEKATVAAEETPGVGWWHQRECCCGTCRR